MSRGFVFDPLMSYEDCVFMAKRASWVGYWDRKAWVDFSKNECWKVFFFSRENLIRRRSGFAARSLLPSTPIWKYIYAHAHNVHFILGRIFIELRILLCEKIGFHTLASCTPLFSPEGDENERKTIADLFSSLSFPLFLAPFELVTRSILKNISLWVPHMLRQTYLYIRIYTPMCYIESVSIMIALSSESQLFDQTDIPKAAFFFRASISLSSLRHLDTRTFCLSPV